MSTLRKRFPHDDCRALTPLFRRRPFLSDLSDELWKTQNSSVFSVPPCLRGELGVIRERRAYAGTGGGPPWGEFTLSRCE